MTVTLSEKLVCVRYRYDKVRNRRYKTAELIVDEVSWTPRRPSGTARRTGATLNVANRIEMD